jgi:SAM-dependent methyltransferase
MMKVFGATYANQYDELVGDKNYRQECDLIEQVFERFGNGKIQALVDFGCGTGSHSIPLAQRGYQVTGVDVSADMLNVARLKSKDVGAHVTWLEGDVRNVEAGGPFDAGLFMFAVLCYQPSNEDIMATLHNARRHIRPGGLLAFDVWYGPAVLSMKPSDRVKIVPFDEGKVIRVVNSQLDSRHHLCTVRYHVWRIIGNRVEAESEESHIVRYFFPMELELMLSQSGFQLTSLTSFPTLNEPADETTWNVLGVARAV